MIGIKFVAQTLSKFSTLAMHLVAAHSQLASLPLRVSPALREPLGSDTQLEAPLLFPGTVTTACLQVDAGKHIQAACL